MFEKEAEEYAKQSCFTEMPNPSLSEDIDISDEIKEAVLYGYNKANEWHFVKDGDLPKDTSSLYYVLVYSWDFGLSHLYSKYGHYIPTVCEWKEDNILGGYFSALDRDAYTNARNIKSCYAWKEIVLPELKEK